MAEVSKRWQTKCHANRKDITNAHESRALFTPREMVYNFWTFAASDPRDKMFAFYSLETVLGSQMASDYHLSLETVYTRAARKMIREQGNLQTLSACVHPSEKMANPPTWVPDSSLPAMNRIPSQLSANAGHCIRTAQKMAARQNLKFKAHDEAPSPERQVVAPDYPRKFQILALDAPVTPWQRRTRPSPQSTRGSMADSVHGHATRQPIRPRSLRLTCPGRVCLPIPRIRAPRRPVRR